MPSASRVNWAKFRVTVTSIVAVTILGILVYLLTGGTLLKSRAILYIYVPDATALSSASPVRVNGVDVGNVETVALSGSNQPNRVVRVSMLIDQDHLRDIPVDSYAETTADNVVGDKYVLITRGVSTTIVRPNEEIPFKVQPELLKSLDLEQFAQRLRTVDVTLSDIEQGRNQLGQFVLGEGAYNDMRRRLTQLDREFRAAISVTTTVGGLIYSDRLYRQIQEPVARLDASLARIQAGQGYLGRLIRDDAQYAQLRNTIASLRQSVAGIESNHLLQSDEQYTSWNRMLASWIRNVDEVRAGPLFNTTATYDNLTGSAKEMRDTVHEFQQDPRKFLRIKLF